MTIPKTGFEKADRYAEALDVLHMQGKGWASAPEIALEAAMRDDSYMRWRKMANAGLRLFGISRTDAPATAPALLYGKAESLASLAILKKAGVIQSTPGQAVGQSPDIAEPETIYRMVGSQVKPAVFRPARVLHDPRDPYMM